MAREYPSSDELIRRAKESALLSDQDVLSKVDQDLSERGMSIGGVDFSMAEDESATPPTVAVATAPTRPVAQPAQPARMRRVDSSSPEHLRLPRRRFRGTTGPAPASDVNSGSELRSGNGMRLLGKALLVFVAIIWLLILVAIPSESSPVGEILVGGVIMTFIPFLFGMLLLRAARNRS